MCRYCDSGFDTKKGLGVHLSAIHRPELNKKQEGQSFGRRSRWSSEDYTTLSLMYRELKDQYETQAELYEVIAAKLERTVEAVKRQLGREHSLQRMPRSKRLGRRRAPVISDDGSSSGDELVVATDPVRENHVWHQDIIRKVKLLVLYHRFCSIWLWTKSSIHPGQRFFTL